MPRQLAQELAGHCTELHQRNASGIAALAAHLRRYGYGGDFRPAAENQPPAAAAETAEHAQDDTCAVGHPASEERQRQTGQLAQRQRDGGALEDVGGAGTAAVHEVQGRARAALHDLRANGCRAGTAADMAVRPADADLLRSGMLPWIEVFAARML
jgi:hypothetical protein